MPWKFIVFIVICIIFSIFIGLNLSNPVTVDFLFVRAENAPVFMVVLFSFLAGACVGLLASVFTKSKKRKKEKLKEKTGQEALPDNPEGEQETAVTPRRRGRTRK